VRSCRHEGGRRGRATRIEWTFSNTPALIPSNHPRRSMLLMSVQPPISTIPCKILYLVANPVLPFPMFSSPAASPTNRSLRPRPSHSHPCHPKHSEGFAFPRPTWPSLGPLLFTPSTFSLFLVPPLFSYSCALFCHNENDNLFVFRRFRTLSQKHPGWGYLLQAKIFSFSNLTTHYSPLSTISFTIRTSKTQHLKPFRMNTYRKIGRGTPHSGFSRAFCARFTTHYPLLTSAHLKPVRRTAHLYLCTCKKGPAAREPRYSLCAAS
jgi:hypothetical protein